MPMDRVDAPFGDERNYDMAYRNLIVAGERGDSEEMKRNIAIMLRHADAKSDD